MGEDPPPGGERAEAAVGAIIGCREQLQARGSGQVAADGEEPGARRLHRYTTSQWVRAPTSSWRGGSAMDRYVGRRALHSRSRHWSLADVVGREPVRGESASRARESLVDVDVMGHGALGECTPAPALGGDDVSPFGTRFGSLPPFLATWPSNRSRFGRTRQAKATGPRPPRRNR